MNFSSDWAKKLPVFTQMDISQIESSTCQLLTKNRDILAGILSQKRSYNWENLMQPLETMNDVLSQHWSPISHLHAVKESGELRKAYHATLPHLTHYHTEITQNEPLFHAISTLKQQSAQLDLNEAQRKIIDNDIRDFKLAGVHLPADKKKHLAELQKELNQLMTTFSENVLDATHAFTLTITDERKLAGLPDDVLQLARDQAKQRGVTGYVLTLDYPCYAAALKFLQDRDLRKTLYEAYVTRASDCGPHAGKWDNTPVMEAILKARQEIATLTGFNNYAEYSLATKMAKSPSSVLHFLQTLLSYSKPLAEKEYQALEAMAQQLDGMTTLAAWDIPYYSEKLRQISFHFSQEALRPYFPIERVLSGMFTIVNKLYGITIKEEKGMDVWHPDVKFFSLYDEQQALRGGFYIDLYARPHKREGAWMDECRARRRVAGGDIQHPVTYLTCNFMPPIAQQPALLAHDDVLTLFHEFGHCLHHLLTKVDYVPVAGINGVPWDAVEFPSQFMENFCWEKASLDLIAAHYQTGAVIPDTLFNNMIAARHFQTGLQMLRQLEFSFFDFRLHLEYDANNPHFIYQLLQNVRDETAVVPVPSFNRSSHAFAHIFAGGYAAGYYSYKWAEVLAEDAYAQFEEQGIFNPSTGHAFMRNILEVGGTRDPLISFIAFRGREPQIDALLRHHGMQQT